jgi:hypothetical protein
VGDWVAGSRALLAPGRWVGAQPRAYNWRRGACIRRGLPCLPWLLPPASAAVHQPEASPPLTSCGQRGRRPPAAAAAARSGWAEGGCRCSQPAAQVQRPAGKKGEGQGRLHWSALWREGQDRQRGTQRCGCGRVEEAGSGASRRQLVARRKPRRRRRVGRGGDQRQRGGGGALRVGSTGGLVAVLWWWADSSSMHTAGRAQH